MLQTLFDVVSDRARTPIDALLPAEIQSKSEFIRLVQKGRAYLCGEAARERPMLSVRRL